MKALKFDRVIAQRGDLLVLERDGTTRLLFKFMAGHYVVATWLEPRPGVPSDAVLLQRQVRRLVAC